MAHPTRDAACPDAVVGRASATITFESPLADAHGAFECRLDGGSWVPCLDGVFDTGDLGEGQHVVEVRVVNAAGDADPTPALCVWTIDTSVPGTWIDVHPPEVPDAVTATFTSGSSASPATLWCVLDPEETPPSAEDYGPCNATEVFEDLEDGEHPIWVYSEDGNVDDGPASYTWTVRGEPLATAITTAPAAEALEGETVTFVCEEPSAPAHVTFE